MDHFNSACKSLHSNLYIPFWITDADTAAMETWRDRARSAMKERGSTQDKLSEAMGMTPAGIQKWLAGTRQPTLEDINQIAQQLNVAPVWLTHGITQDHVADGLPPEAIATIVRLIRGQRAGKLGPSFWRAIEAVADSHLAPVGVPIAEEHREELEQLSQQAEEKHGRSKQRNRATRR